MTTRQDDKVHYTYADYLEFDESVRCELIGGDIFLRSPPITSHQRVLSRLFLKLSAFLEGKTGEIFTPPFSLRLAPKEDLSDDTVFQPDIIVVRDSTKISGHSCIAAPDMVIEILSTLSDPIDPIDRTIKFNAYQKAGIQEYWLADPEIKTLHACVLENGKYTVSRYTMTDTAPVNSLPGCEINLETIFAN
jgi:Uma2 family endonuclease